MRKKAIKGDKSRWQKLEEKQNEKWDREKREQNMQ